MTLSEKLKENAKMDIITGIVLFIVSVILNLAANNIGWPTSIKIVCILISAISIYRAIFGIHVLFVVSKFSKDYS